MARKLYYIISFILFLVLRSTHIHAQETQDNINAAEQYLNAKTEAQNNFLDKASGIQQRLLRKLQRKEAKVLKRLAAKDSALYYQYMRQGISYDSIATLSKDSTYLSNASHKRSPLADSLKGVQQFIQNQRNKLSGASGLGAQAGVNLPYTSDINNMQQKLSVQQGVDALIQQKTKYLESMGSNVQGLEGLQKEVYYAREKIKNWKKVADDPDEAEERAMEYLQGTEGFDKYMNSNNDAFGGLGNNATAADLQSKGFQTKSQVNGMLEEKLGGSLGAMQDQLGKQLADYTQKLGGITGKLNGVKNSINEAKQTVNEAKQTKNQLQHIEKPAFGKNPERGKPFWQRIEHQYSFQTTRATADKLEPAMLVLNASLSYKQNSKLSYGLGIGISAGLGQDWQHLKLSYEGVSTKAFIDWKLCYGFSAQLGYERIFRPANRPYLPENEDQMNNANNPANVQASNNAIKDAFGGQQQSLYAGIMKRYKINSTWNGTFLAGYNFLWQQEGSRSPWILQFGLSK